MVFTTTRSIIANLQDYTNYWNRSKIIKENIHKLERYSIEYRGTENYNNLFVNELKRKIDELFTAQIIAFDLAHEKRKVVTTYKTNQDKN